MERAVQLPCGVRRPRRMTSRSWVILAVPAAAISRAPATAAKSRATPSDRRRWAPRKLMLTACGFWTTKASTTTRPMKAAISVARTPLIRVRTGLGAGLGTGLDSSGGACPFGDGGGRMPVVPSGAGGLVIALLLAGAGGDSALLPCAPGVAAVFDCFFRASRPHTIPEP